MSMLGSDTLFRLPSVRNFVSRLVDDLSNSRSLLILLPVGVDLVELRDAVRSELWRRDFEVAEVSLASLPTPKERPLVASLGEALGIGWTSDSPRTIPNLMDAVPLPDILLLEDLDQLCPEASETWTAFVEQWSHHCRRRIDRGSSTVALCVMGRASTVLPHLPESSVHLGVHWWWGFPSNLETRVLCRSNNEGGDWDIATRWREFVLPALSGNDVSLVEELWDVVNLDVAELLNRLQILAEQRGWKDVTLRKWGLGVDGVRSRSSQGFAAAGPPTNLRALWAQGVVGCTLEYGPELHSAALAVLECHDEIRHRVWRGQAELLFPFLDRIRLQICSVLSSKYGSDWPVRWIPPKSSEEDKAVRENPLACQWGHLKAVLSQGPLLRTYQNWLPLITIAHSIRNNIAHYRPVTFLDFEGLWREVARVTDSGSLEGARMGFHSVNLPES